MKSIDQLGSIDLDLEIYSMLTIIMWSMWTLITQKLTKINRLFNNYILKIEMVIKKVDFRNTMIIKMIQYNT